LELRNAVVWIKPLRVIKIGGQSADDADFLARFAEVIGALEGSSVIVHGGGESVSSLERSLHAREPVFVQGKRRTDEKTLQLAEMVLCGSLNKKIVRCLGLNSRIIPVGLSGQDAGLLRAEVESGLGFVARNVTAQTKLLGELCRQGYTPVIAPLALAADGSPLNANADDVACAVAKAMCAGELIFMTNVPCVYAGNRRIERLGRESAEKLIADGLITGGMVVKVRAALEAAEKSNARVRICSLGSLAAGEDTVIEAGQSDSAEKTTQMFTALSPQSGSSNPDNSSSGSSLAPLFSKINLQICAGDGMYLSDSAGKRWLDFSSGIAVNALGHGHPKIVAALVENSIKPLHLSNLFPIGSQEILARKLVSSCFADHAFFCNSGTEANEAALKFAMKYHYAKGDSGRSKVVAFRGGFHGRTLGSLSVTEKANYRLPFQMGLFDAEFLDFNDTQCLDESLNESVAAVIVEPVQGESGIYPADAGFLHLLRRLCNERGIVLIFDEVQCGMMRTGVMWAHQSCGAEPDILTTAKPLGGGLPLGAALLSSKISSALSAGDHGSTFGGNPLACALANVVFDEVTGMRDGILAAGAALGEILSEFKRRYPHLVEAVRGAGLMWGFDVRCTVNDVLERARNHGLLLLTAGTKTIRLLPPLICNANDLSEFRRIMHAVLDELSAKERKTVRLRPAVSGDVSAVCELISECAERRELLPRSRRSVEESLADFIVAECNGVPVGCVSARKWSPAFTEVRSLAVVKGFQGAGIGRSLLAELIGRVRQAGPQEIFALTLSPEFFKSCGFSVRSRERYAFKEKEDCLKCEYFTDCREVPVGLDLVPAMAGIPLETSVHESF
jgi:acetylglutamate kinase